MIKCLVVSFLATISAAYFFFSGPVQAATNHLKVLTLNFNAEVVPFDDNHQTMRNLRYRALIQFVKEQSPDVIFLQEGWSYDGKPSVSIPLADAIGYDYFYRIDLGFPLVMYDSDAILAKKELKMSQTKVIQLPHSACHLGDGVTWLVPLGSASYAVGARLTLPDGSPVLAYSTHFLGANESEKKDQLEALDQAIRAHAAENGIPWEKANVIWGGDTNSDWLTAPIARAAELGYADTFAAAHPEHAQDEVGATECSNPRKDGFNPMTLGAGQFPAQDEAEPNQRIDYIFARGPALKTLASTVTFTHPYGGFWMSDHYALLTTLGTDGTGAVGDEPNPVTDSGPVVRGRPRLISFDDGIFSACDRSIDCDLRTGTVLVRGIRGLALLYMGGDEVFARITGPKRVWPSRTADLRYNNAASFVFLESGPYTLKLTNSVGDQLTVPLDVCLEN